jgi:hypothetical protein
MNLKQLQDTFQDYILAGTQDRILPEIANGSGLSTERRLQIYYDGYRIRLREILQLDFPKTHTLLGDEHFYEAFDEYLKKNPSHHFSVRYFGQHFTNFLANTAPYQAYPALAEMANFEWKIASTIDAEDANIATIESFAKIAPTDWPNLVFTLHPSVTHALFAFDTPKIWQLIENEEPMRAPIAADSPVCWLFWRKSMRSYFKSCSKAEEKMFQALQNNACFGDICESLLHLLPESEVPAFAAQTLYQWVQDEMISSIHVLPESAA